MWWTGGRGRRHLQLIHNVRPAMMLADPPREWRLSLLMTIGMLGGLAAFLLFMLRQPIG